MKPAIKSRVNSLRQTIAHSKRRCDGYVYGMQQHSARLEKECPNKRPAWFAMIDDKYVGEIEEIIYTVDSKGKPDAMCLRIKTKPGLYSQPVK